MPPSEKRWTFDTLPPLPDDQPEGVTEEQWAIVWAARYDARSGLIEAEKAEAEARTLRTHANAAAKHYTDLLEELVSDPLFTLEDADG